MDLKLIDYDTAKLAREVGFDLEVEYTYTSDRGSADFFYDFDDYNQYDDNYSAPTQALLHKWLMDKFQMIVCISYLPFDNSFTSSVYKKENYPVTAYNTPLISYDSYEEVLEAGLKVTLQYLIDNT